MGCNNQKNTSISDGRFPSSQNPGQNLNQSNLHAPPQLSKKQLNKLMALNAPRNPQTGKIVQSKFPFWHQIIDYLKFEDLTKASALSHHLMNEATHNHIFSKFDSLILSKPFANDEAGKTINTKRSPQQLFHDDDEHATGDLDEEEEDEEWEEEEADPHSLGRDFNKTKTPKREERELADASQDLDSMGNTFNTLSQISIKQDLDKPLLQKVSIKNQQAPPFGKQFTLIKEEDEALEQSFQFSQRKLQVKENSSTKFEIKPMHTLEVPNQKSRIDVPIEQYLKQQEKAREQRTVDNLNRTMVFRKAQTQDQPEKFESKNTLKNNPPYKRQGESVVYKVVINSVIDSSLDQPQLKKRESFEFKLPPDHQILSNSQEDPYFLNSQDGSIMQYSNSFLKIPVTNSEIAETPRTIKNQNDKNMEFFQKMNTLKIPSPDIFDQYQNQGQYAILHQSQYDNKIQKQFGVYQFDNDQPLIDKRPQRLIERLALKQEIEGTGFKKRSIAGGAGLQIVFQANSKPKFEDKLPKKAEDELPKRLPKFDEIQKLKSEVFN